MARVSVEEMRTRLQSALSAVGTEGEYQSLLDNMSEFSPVEVSQAVKRAEGERLIELYVAAHEGGKATLRYRVVGGGA